MCFAQMCCIGALYLNMRMPMDIVELHWSIVFYIPYVRWNNDSSILTSRLHNSYHIVYSNSSDLKNFRYTKATQKYI
jgi:hypothetical protein